MQIQGGGTRDVIIKKYKAIDLVNPFRFDIMAKFIYAQSREWHVESLWPVQVYSEHIRLWGNFVEKGANGKPEKVGLPTFLNSFHKILDSIKANGYDINKPPIPLGDYCISNGAHRVTACLLYDKDVICKETHGKGKGAASAKKFRSRGLQEKYLDAMALKYCELKNNTYLAVVFPCVRETNMDTVREIFGHYGSIVHEKKIVITNEGPLNLIKLLYTKEEWCKTDAPLYKRCKKNMLDRFPGYNPGIEYTIRVFLIESPSLKDVVECKTLIRKYFKKGRQSIHINDNHYETLSMAQCFFNKNSIHFLNFGKPETYKNLNILIDKYKDFLINYNVIPEWFCVVGEMSLTVYGLKACDSLDFIYHGCNILPVSPTGGLVIENVNNKFAPYHVLKDDIIFNQENFFYYKGLKFISLNMTTQLQKQYAILTSESDTKAITNFIFRTRQHKELCKKKL
jgi:hypothetical protein